LTARVETRVETLLKTESPGAPASLLSARLAMRRGDFAAASAWTRKALSAHPGSEGAMRLRLHLAMSQANGDEQAARAYIARWAKGEARQRLLNAKQRP